MLLRSYSLRIVLQECNPSSPTVNAIASLSDDIGEILPYLNAVLKGCTYHPEAGILRFLQEGRAITFYPRQITVTKLTDEAEARQILDQVTELVNSTYEKRNKIEPSYKRGDEIKVFDVYKLLPGTNCRQCGEPTCFAFANKLARQEAKLTDCQPFHSEEYGASRQRLVSLLEAAGWL